MAYLLLVSAFLLNAVANILLKKGAMNGVRFDTSFPEFLYAHVAIIGGFIAFALNALLYFLALRTLPITIAYPVMVGMSFLIITAAGVIYFGETLSVVHVAGYVLLAAGVAVVLYASTL
jgi:multidrug transporter EmrE-like cation transporter